MSKAISRRDFLKVTGAVGAAGLLAACGGSSNSTAASTASSAAAASVAGLSSDPVTLTMSWWGGESRHNAYQEALKAFSAEHSNVTVNPTFAAWSGWEDTMSTKFAGGVAEDVCQINWNWLYNYSANGQTFIDLNSVTDYLDMSQWDDAKLAACNVANAQQCVPVAMTGRIFYWNMTTFNKAGITEVPKTLDDLMNACNVQGRAHFGVDGFSGCQRLIQLQITDNVTKGGSRQVLNSHDGIFHAVSIQLGIRNLEKYYRINPHGYVILGDNRLGSEINHLLLQVHLSGYFIDEGHFQFEPHTPGSLISA